MYHPYKYHILVLSVSKMSSFFLLTQDVEIPFYNTKHVPTTNIIANDDMTTTSSKIKVDGTTTVYITYRIANIPSPYRLYDKTTGMMSILSTQYINSYTNSRMSHVRVLYTYYNLPTAIILCVLYAAACVYNK